MTATTEFDLDRYLDRCTGLYHYLNQRVVWCPRAPRQPLRIAEMDAAWRHNAARFLMRRAQHLAHMYRFGMVRVASAPVLRGVVGEVDGEPVFAGPAFSQIDLMGDHTLDAFEAEQDQVTANPERWLRGTPLHLALVDGLPEGSERDRLAEIAKHWAACPVRSGRDVCRCGDLTAERRSGDAQ